MPRPTKKRQNQPSLEATAYHEAGHAVASIWHGRGLRRVTIVPDERRGLLGYVEHPKRPRVTFQPEWKDLDEAPFQTLVIREILVVLAGPAAEERFTGRANPDGARGDMDHVNDLAYRVCPDDDERMHFVGWLEARSRCFVHRPMVWTGIEGVARALLERPTMSGREVKEAYHEAHRNWRPVYPIAPELAACLGAARER
jgi:hypothetical protein